MEKKYILTDETMDWFGRTLHRIQAIRDFGDVKAGDLGGWIEKEGNLSQYDLCWVNNEAKVYDNAKVFDNSQISDTTLVFSNALVLNNAQISDNAQVFDNARASGEAQISGNARVFGNAQISGNVLVFDNARISGSTQVFGDTDIFSLTKLRSNSLIRSSHDYITIGPIGSRSDHTTFAKSPNGDILVFCGYFTGTLEEFEDRVKKACEENKRRFDYITLTKFIKGHYNETQSYL